MPEDGGKNPTVEQVRKRSKWDKDDYVYRGLILNGMSNFLFDIYQKVETSKELWDTLEAKYMAQNASSKKFLVSNFTTYKMADLRPVLEQYNELLDFKHTLKHLNEELTLVELGSHLRIKEYLRAHDSDKPKRNNVVGPSVANIVEHNNSFRYNDNKGKREHHDNKADPNKKPKVTCWKYGKHGHLKKDCKAGNDDDIAWLVDSGATMHVCKDRCWFKTYESLNDRSILHMGNESIALVHGCGCVDLSFSSGKKTLGERDIKCICVGYVEHSKAFRFYVIEPNDSVAINSIIESRDAIFDDNRFLSVLRPSQRSLKYGTGEFGVLVVLEKVTDEIFKRKLKEYGTVERFKARLVIHGFKQKLGIEYFDTYAQMARISTIRLLIAMKLIYSLIIHQMDVKTTFLNGELDELVYMNQAQGFIMPGNENKVCKLIKSLYGLNQAPKQWYQKFDEVVLFDGYLLNQADKCVYRKFDESSKGVNICLYVDDMLIFGTDQVQVDLKKEFLSSRFYMKDMGEADVILSMRIKHESNGIAISQSHYIENVLKKFNYFACTLVSTPMDTYKKLMPNEGQAISQLEYSRVIGCLMYAMTCTRPDIVFVMCKLSRYTSNLGTQHWQAIQRVFLLGGGAISWDSKKQTCITGSTMESCGSNSYWNNNLVLNTPPSTDPIHAALAAIQESFASIQAEVKLHSTEIASLKRGEGTSQPRTDELTAQLRPL
uniref:Zinc finger, CCHC-type n=1 Tax=Tanacetum cinerariifolium TaxID=118510 RepID=A0A699HNQ7_TANCI|nr:zinc finger, CCHC-type [Tanacetum cinerariifolium]